MAAHVVTLSHSGFLPRALVVEPGARVRFALAPDVGGCEFDVACDGVVRVARGGGDGSGLCPSSSDDSDSAGSSVVGGPSTCGTPLTSSPSLLALSDAQAPPSRDGDGFTGRWRDTSRGAFEDDDREGDALPPGLLAPLPPSALTLLLLARQQQRGSAREGGLDAAVCA